MGKKKKKKKKKDLYSCNECPESPCTLIVLEGEGYPCTCPYDFVLVTWKKIIEGG